MIEENNKNLAKILHALTAVILGAITVFLWSYKGAGPWDLSGIASIFALISTVLSCLNILIASGIIKKSKGAVIVSSVAFIAWAVFLGSR